MKIDLSGKLAIVSGSTAGIGLGISKALAESGATVVVIGRETAKVEQALATIREQVPGAQLRGLTADLDHPACGGCRGSRQPGGLHRLAAVFGHHWCGVAR